MQPRWRQDPPLATTGRFSSTSGPGCCGSVGAVWLGGANGGGWTRWASVGAIAGGRLRSAGIATGEVRHASGRAFAEFWGPASLPAVARDRGATGSAVHPPPSHFTCGDALAQGRWLTLRCHGRVRYRVFAGSRAVPCSGGDSSPLPWRPCCVPAGEQQLVRIPARFGSFIRSARPRVAWP